MEELLKQIADLVSEYERTTDDILGVYVTKSSLTPASPEENHEYDGEAFVKWQSHWCVKKTRRSA